jgi:hypothetical protein
MVEGLWTVQFESGLSTGGNGVIVLTKDKRLLGGDFGYYYTGHYAIDNSNISAEADIIRFEPNSVSVFGDIDDVHLKIEGRLIGPNEFKATGFVQDRPGEKITIIGRKKVDMQ